MCDITFEDGPAAIMAGKLGDAETFTSDFVIDNALGMGAETCRSFAPQVYRFDVAKQLLGSGKDPFRRVPIEMILPVVSLAHKPNRQIVSEALCHVFMGGKTMPRTAWFLFFSACDRMLDGVPGEGGRDVGATDHPEVWRFFMNEMGHHITSTPTFSDVGEPVPLYEAMAAYMAAQGDIESVRMSFSAVCLMARAAARRASGGDGPNVPTLVAWRVCRRSLVKVLVFACMRIAKRTSAPGGGEHAAAATEEATGVIMAKAVEESGVVSHDATAAKKDASATADPTGVEVEVDVDEFTQTVDPVACAATAFGVQGLHSVLDAMTLSHQLGISIAGSAREVGLADAHALLGAATESVVGEAARTAAMLGHGALLDDNEVTAVLAVCRNASADGVSWLARLEAFMGKLLDSSETLRAVWGRSGASGDAAVEASAGASEGQEEAKQLEPGVGLALVEKQFSRFAHGSRADGLTPPPFLTPFGPPVFWFGDGDWVADPTSCDFTSEEGLAELRRARSAKLRELYATSNVNGYPTGQSQHFNLHRAVQFVLTSEAFARATEYDDRMCHAVAQYLLKDGKGNFHGRYIGRDIKFTVRSYLALRVRGMEEPRHGARVWFADRVAHELALARERWESEAAAADLAAAHEPAP